MDFGRLRTLRELSMRKTMAAVAGALYISPSAVSQQITQLEYEAGLNLVERRGRGVKLTPAGRKLVEHADRIMGVLEEAKTDLAAMKKAVAGELRVAAFPSIATVVIPPTIMNVTARYPKLGVSFNDLEPSDGLAALRAWQTDIAIVDDLTVTDAQLEANIETIELTTDTLYAMLAAKHPLALKKALRFKDLRNEKWALDTGSYAYGDMIVRECRAAGFEPVINGHCTGFDAVLALVEAGCSVSVLPGLRIHRVKHFRSDVVMRPIVPAMTRRIFLAFRRGELRNPAISAFVDELRDVAKRSEETTAAG